MKDRQHGAVANRVEKFYSFPRAFERTGFRFAVADDTRHQQRGIVEGCTKRVRKRVAELAAFMDRSRHVRTCVTWYTTRRRELPEQAAHPLFVLSDRRIEFRIRPFQVGLRDQRRTSVTR